METGAQSIAGRLVRETVNDVLPDGFHEGAGGFMHREIDLGRLPEIVAPETDGPDYVRLPRGVARLLLLASDVLSEHWKTMVSATPQLTIVDIQVDTIDVLTEAGLVDPETGGVTEAFEAALAIAGQALGISAADLRPAPDDGEGIDQLAGANDDYEQDVEAAEKFFTKDGDLFASPDPDWAGEPRPSILDALPAASSFGGD